MQRFLQLRQQQQQQAVPAQAMPTQQAGMPHQQAGLPQLPQGVQAYTNPLAMLRQQAVLRQQEQEQGNRPSTAGSGASSGTGGNGRGTAAAGLGSPAGLAAAAAAAAAALAVAEDGAGAGAAASGRVSARSSPQRIAATQMLSQGWAGADPAAAFASTFTNPLALESEESESDGGSELGAAAAAAAAVPAASTPAVGGSLAAAGRSPLEGAAISPSHAAAQQDWAHSEITPAGDGGGGGSTWTAGRPGRSGSTGLGSQRAGTGPSGMAGRRGGFMRPVGAAGSLSAATSLAALHVAARGLSAATSLADPRAAGSLSPATSLRAPHPHSRLAAGEAPHPPIQPPSAHPRHLLPSRAGSAAATTAVAADTSIGSAGISGAPASRDEALDEFAAAVGAFPGLPTSPGRSQHSGLPQHSATRASYTFMPWDAVSRFEGQAEAAQEAAATADASGGSGEFAATQQDGTRDAQLAGTAVPTGAQPDPKASTARAGGNTVSRSTGSGSMGSGSASSRVVPQAGEQQMPPVELHPVQPGGPPHAAA